MSGSLYRLNVSAGSAGSAGCGGVSKRSVNRGASAVLAISGIQCVPGLIDTGCQISEGYGCMCLLFSFLIATVYSTYKSGNV